VHSFRSSRLVPMRTSAAPSSLCRPCRAQLFFPAEVSLPRQVPERSAGGLPSEQNRKTRHFPSRPNSSAAWETTWCWSLWPVRQAAAGRRVWQWADIEGSLFSWTAAETRSEWGTVEARTLRHVLGRGPTGRSYERLLPLAWPRGGHPLWAPGMCQVVAGADVPPSMPSSFVTRLRTTPPDRWPLPSGLRCSYAAYRCPLTTTSKGAASCVSPSVHLAHRRIVVGIARKYLLPAWAGRPEPSRRTQAGVLRPSTCHKSWPAKGCAMPTSSTGQALPATKLPPLRTWQRPAWGMPPFVAWRARRAFPLHSLQSLYGAENVWLGYRCSAWPGVRLGGGVELTRWQVLVHRRT